MKKGICSLIIMFIITAVFVFTGCSPKALTDNPETSAQVISNGGTTVVKGDYLYFINGYVDEDTLDPKYDNKENKVNHTGIYRTKLVNGEVVKNEEGFLTNVDRVVSKVVGFDNGGFFIIDDYIYYTTPNMNYNKDGSKLTDRVDFHRINIDGTKDKLIYSSPVAEDTLDWTCYKVDGKVYILAYYANQEKTIMAIDTEEREVVAEVKNVTSYAFYDETNYSTNNDRSNAILNTVYYTRDAVESDNKGTSFKGNMLCKFNFASETKEEVIATNDNHTFMIKSVTKDNVYYTKADKSYNGKALLYKTSTDFNFDNEVKMSNKEYTTYYICDFGYDMFLGATDSAVFRVMKNGSGEIISTQILTSADTILGIYGGYGYYALEEKLYKFDILNGEITDNLIKADIACDDSFTMKVGRANLIDFDNQRVYLFVEYTSADESKNFYMNFVEPNSTDQKFVGSFEESHLPQAPEETDEDGDGVVENIPHVK